MKSSFAVQRTIGALFTGGRVLVTSDGQWMVTAVGEDVLVTDIRSGNRIQHLSGDSEIITSMALRPNKLELVTASRSLQLTHWDLSTGKIIRQWKAHEAPVLVMDFDATGTLVATGSADSTIRVWQLDQNMCTHCFRGHRGVISVVKFHPRADEWTLFSSSEDGVVRRWDLVSKKCTKQMESHVSVVRALDVSACGRYLLSASRDKVVTIWSLPSGNVLHTFPILETLEAAGFLPSSDSQDLFFTAGDKGMVRVWRLNDGECVFEQPAPIQVHPLTEAYFSKVLDALVVANTDHNIMTYTWVEGELVLQHQWVGYNQEIVDTAFVGSQRQYLAVATNSEQLRVYHLESGDCEVAYGHTGHILGLDTRFDTNGRSWILSAGKDKTARLWLLDELENDKVHLHSAAVCVGHAEAVGTVGFSKRRAVENASILTGSQDRTVKRWRFPTELELLESEGQFPMMAEYTVKVHDKDINTLAIAPNDKYFATGSQDKTAKIWNTTDGSLVGNLQGHRRGVWCVRFSPVDQVVATSSGDKTIKLWSLQDFTCLKTFEGHTNSVLRVDFLSAGLQLVSSGSDGLTKVWTIKSNECVTTLDDHDDKIWALAVLDSAAAQSASQPDDQSDCLIVTGSADAKLVIYRDNTQEIEVQKEKEREERLLLEQDLSNCLVTKDYRKAIYLAMRLGHPLRLAQLFLEVLENKPADCTAIMGDDSIDSILSKLSDEKLNKLLLFVREWNTNAKLARVAQAVLHLIMKKYSPERLAGLKDIHETLTALLPYTEKHYQRMDDLVTRTWLLEYTLNQMDALLI